MTRQSSPKKHTSSSSGSSRGTKRRRNTASLKQSTVPVADGELKDIRKRQKLEDGKKKKIDTKSAFEQREKEYDAALPPEYRKLRPKGYPLKMPPTDRPVRVYADGVFDLFHLGHMRQLEQCKKAFPNVYLIIGIPNDKETHSRKGLTVLTDKQRYETVRHCKWVDEVIEDAPWIITMDFVKEHKIDYCAHDDIPYVADGIEDIYKPMKTAGRFIATQRTHGISTSYIITKIIRDYDKYLMRNFARGATRKELNVSWLKKNELDLKKQINDFRKSWRNYNDSIKYKSKDLYTIVRESLRKNSHIARHIGRRAPVDKFAMKYNANGLYRAPQKRSLLDSLMGWVGFGYPKDEQGDDYDVYLDDSENALDSESAEEGSPNNIPTIRIRKHRPSAAKRLQSNMSPRRKVIIPKQIHKNITN